MKILHLDSSIQGESSVSRSISAAIVESLRRTANNIDVVYRDLGTNPIPHMTLARFGTEDGINILDQFLAADILVIGAPMYNFGIPTQLKSWFDHVLVAGKTFRYGPNGAEGLVGSKQAVVALSRGGIYSEGVGMQMEHTESHLRSMLGFIGISKPEFIVAEGLAISPEHRDKAFRAALDRASGIKRLRAA